MIYTPFALFSGFGILVTGNARSGTTLMVSLMDSHPQTMTLPVETKFSTAMWQPDPMHYLTKERCLAQMQSPTHRGVTHYFNYDNLVESFFQFCSTDTGYATLFTAVIYAFHNEFSRFGMDSGRIKYWVEKTPAHYKIFNFFKRIFPCIKNVHMVRNPFDMYASWKSRQPGNTMELFFKELQFSLKHTQQYKKEILVVRYEDLVTNPACILELLRSYLSLEYSETLLHPTIIGKKYGGNSSQGRSFNSISMDSLYGFSTILTQEEILQLQENLTEYIAYFGYDFLCSSKQCQY